MDFLIHYGVLRNANKEEVKFKPFVLKTSMVINIIILVGLIYIKGKDDPFLLGITIVSMLIVYFLEKWFLRDNSKKNKGIL